MAYHQKYQKQFGGKSRKIQETKVQQLSDTSLDNHRVIFFKTKSPHYVNGFVVSPQLKNNIHNYWYVSDRVKDLTVLYPDFVFKGRDRSK